MEKWSEKAWKHSLPTYTKILQMPYIKELMAGTLPQRCFTFYIQQDELYLKDYGKALNAIVELLPKQSHKELFTFFAEEAVLSEQQLHESFIKKLQIEPQTQKSKACLSYTNFLNECTLRGDLEVSLAAILPCFWVYNEVGKYVVANQNKKGNNPYQAWIDTYSCDEFDNEVRQCIDVCDEYASTSPEKHDAMTEAYAIGTLAEFNFWDSAYRLDL